MQQQQKKHWHDTNAFFMTDIQIEAARFEMTGLRRLDGNRLLEGIKTPLAGQT